MPTFAFVKEGKSVFTFKGASAQKLKESVAKFI